MMLIRSFHSCAVFGTVAFSNTCHIFVFFLMARHLELCHIYIPSTKILTVPNGVDGVGANRGRRRREHRRGLRHLPCSRLQQI